MLSYFKKKKAGAESVVIFPSYQVFLSKEREHVQCELGSRACVCVGALQRYGFHVKRRTHSGCCHQLQTESDSLRSLQRYIKVVIIARYLWIGYWLLHPEITVRFLVISQSWTIVSFKYSCRMLWMWKRHCVFVLQKGFTDFLIIIFRVSCVTEFGCFCSNPRSSAQPWLHF